MLNLEFATHYAASMIFLLVGVLLILRKHEGEASRMYLAVFYIGMSFIFGYEAYLYYHNLYPNTIISIPYIIVGVIYSLFYLIYPIEVVSPGYMTGKRFLYLFFPLILCILFYLLSVQQGVVYQEFNSLNDLVTEPLTGSAVFIYVLLALIFMPQLLLYCTLCMKRYNTTNKKWVIRFIFISSLTSIGYLCKLYFFDKNEFIHLPIYFLISCYVIYLELYVRVLHKQNDVVELLQAEPVLITPEHHEVHALQETKMSYDRLIQNRVTQFLETEKPWRNPNFTLQDLINKTGINRKELSNIIQDQGFDNFPNYLNALRVKDFISILEHGKFDSFQNIFFDVGFRSRATAHRNFKQVTGESPSEYFAKIKKK